MRERAANPPKYGKPKRGETNPAWTEEIMRGPHYDPKSRTHKPYSPTTPRPSSQSTSKRKLTSAGKDTASIHTTTTDGLPGPATASPPKSKGKGKAKAKNKGKGKEPIPAAAGGSGINDHHPPIIRQQPADKDALQWMILPPPPAKFMDGKEDKRRNGVRSESFLRRPPVEEEKKERMVVEVSTDSDHQKENVSFSSPVPALEFPKPTRARQRPRLPEAWTD
ncbi:hypothetical protein F5Y17DRAFT_461533 [Xylariaceae sp. FL0594]|nr:hypothetical protein F5Y17DRAFT_461533 [Xylariaceae sp. FL0594]